MIRRRRGMTMAGTQGAAGTEAYGDPALVQNARKRTKTLGNGRPVVESSGWQSVGDPQRTWLVRRAERHYAARLGRLRHSELSWHIAWKWLPALVGVGLRPRRASLRSARNGPRIGWLPRCSRPWPNPASGPQDLPGCRRLRPFRSALPPGSTRPELRHFPDPYHRVGCTQNVHADHQSNGQPARW